MQIYPNEEGEEVGTVNGPMRVRAVWLATSHDEWGIGNAPGTGLVMSELVFERAARSVDCESLDPKHLLV